MTQLEALVRDAQIQLPQLLCEVMQGMPLYQHLTEMWHRQPAEQLRYPDGTLACLGQLHACNFRLWHTEDRVRRPDASDRMIAECKRTIDGLNQQRHNQIERLDALLYSCLYEHHNRLQPDAELHSETPGSLVDRLSIATLKVYHMAREAGRDDAAAPHRQRCRERLTVLEEQRHDLYACLCRLCLDLWHGRKRFKRYRQFKMYNDPELNPEIYRHRSGQQALQA
jgi:hypothetical protein